MSTDLFIPRSCTIWQHRMNQYAINFKMSYVFYMPRIVPQCCQIKEFSQTSGGKIQRSFCANVLEHGHIGNSSLNISLLSNNILFSLNTKNTTQIILSIRRLKLNLWYLEYKHMKIKPTTPSTLSTRIHIDPSYSIQFYSHMQVQDFNTFLKCRFISIRMHASSEQ